MDMPVPSSYNDISTSASVRDHVGLAWYDRRFQVSDHWLESILNNNRKIFLRFGSVHYATQVVSLKVSSGEIWSLKVYF